MVAEEHHGFLAQLVGDIDHFLGKGSNLAALERLEIAELLARHAVLVVEVALIDDELRTELVADLAFELLEDIRGNGGGIAIPVDVLFTLERIEHQRELMEERGIADHVHIRMLRDELAQALHGIGAGLRLAHVKGDLVLDALPVVDHGVIHMHRIPDQIAEEGNGVLVVRRRLIDDDKAVFIAPAVRGDNLAGRTVHNLPPAGDIIAGVRLQELGGKVIHQLNLQRLFPRHAEARHDVALLHLVRVRLRPCVILAGGIIGRIHLRAHLAQLGREIGAVAVADGVRTPAGKQFKRLRYDVDIGRDRYAAAKLLFIAHVHILHQNEMIL